jgi:hypothetical protein
MGGIGRRATVSMMYDVIITLVLLALCAMAMFSYISGNADGRGYFARFYAVDLASSADVVSAGYGDVSLRYDNLKPNLKLSFRNDDHSVSVAMQEADKTPLATAYYGKAVFEGQEKIDNPSFIILRKVEGVLSITDADKTLRACPWIVEKQVPIAGAVVHLEASDQIKEAFARTLPSITTTEDAAEANILLAAELRTDLANTVKFSRTSKDGAAVACNFVQQLGALTPALFDATDPEVVSGPMRLAITITAKQDAKLTEEQVGKALAHALAVYYR